MTEQEAKAIDALKVYMIAVNRYNEIIDRPHYDVRSDEFIDAANAMEDADNALQEAAQPLLTVEV